MEYYLEQIKELLDDAEEELSKEELENLLDTLKVDCTDRENLLLTLSEDANGG